MPPVRSQAEYEQQGQREKLASSYHSLLNEFSSPELHTVGNYTLGRLIGKGSFGKVYLASHKLTNGSKVVLKSAKKDDANLAREIHHHRQFLHPHIARLYEVIVTESLVWLVLEWCPGDELYNHLLKHGRMEPAKVQKIFTQLVGAVSYVHGKSCVHRDLKLENILLDKHENVKLVDFGFTREYQGVTSYLQTWCGTVCYSAPEMLKGEKYAGEKVDVWSLGIILYALLCGELPWDDDDEATTKQLILKEDPKLPDYLPDPAKELIKKLLAKRPILRPALGDILKDLWLAEHAPQQHEILKVQQPPAFSTQVEKDTLQRMKSAGVDIDVVIENVLSQRCDALAGWWALLIEKEQRKEKRKDRKRREREAEAKSLRRLSAASSRLLSQGALLGEIQEGEEAAVLGSPSARGRRPTRASGPNGSLAKKSMDLPRVVETKSPTPERSPLLEHARDSVREVSRSRSRPPPPPKDTSVVVPRPRPRNSPRSNSMLRYSTVNPDLLSPAYVPPPQRKRRTFYPQPLKEQLAWVKHWFKEGAKRAKSPNSADGKKGKTSPTPGSDGSSNGLSQLGVPEIQRTLTGPLPQHRKASVGDRPGLQSRATMPARPRINTMSSTESRNSLQRNRTSLSPGTMTPHSSYRRSSAGLRGRKSTSSSVSSIRSAYQSVGGHQHTHSKASSTSSSVASPSGMSTASGVRNARSPHASVKVLPATPTNGTFPSGLRINRRPVPGGLGTLPTFAESSSRPGFSLPPGSPSLPVFARRKRSVFKGPLSGSPSAFGRAAAGNSSRSGSVPGRRSGEMIMGITEEDEEDAELDAEYEDEEVEEVDQFGPELDAAISRSELSATGPVIEIDEDFLGPVTPVSTVLPANVEGAAAAAVTAPPHIASLADGSARTTPLTAAALARMEEEEEGELDVTGRERDLKDEVFISSK
ncbi:hypothetical protein LTR62_003792 [Meristemomyces frigidus]|uniref:Protein kinase domain-containing protein n=1 Tax=Meristemomyces frigidus TaxID=1508187 RepID=A0AAN7TKE6_9PEZI|nr:hypothetical protein LTR62_003792 [Meristemomyces frigidus]